MIDEMPIRVLQATRAPYKGHENKKEQVKAILETHSIERSTNLETLTSIH
jgi:hypothetical protein